MYGTGNLITYINHIWDDSITIIATAYRPQAAAVDCVLSPYPLGSQALRLEAVGSFLTLESVYLVSPSPS